MSTQKYGIGLEHEGYLLTSAGEPVVRIQGKPASEFIIQEAVYKFPKLKEHLSVELPSIVLEVKSKVHAVEATAIQEIMEIRELVNRLLPEGVSLVFTPVCDRPYEFIASTSDPNSRAQQLIEKWGSSAQGKRMLYASAICSMQINDSRIFQDIPEIEEPRLQVALKIHNLFSSQFDELCSFNSPARDVLGNTRLESYLELMAGVKGQTFESRGYTKAEIIKPPFFSNIEAMQAWMCAHSNVQDFKDAHSKDEHAATVKIKRGEFWAVETRIFDSVNTETEILERVRKNSSFLGQIKINL